LAKHNICNAIDFGKLPFPEILYFETYLRQSDPSMAKQNQEEAEINKMIEVFKNVK
jgi:hypothetical protein